MKKKKKSNTPRRKSFKRPQRLESAKTWISTYEGKKIVQGYAKCYGVDLLCAITELQMLGHKFSDDYINRVKTSLENQRRAKEEKKREKELVNISESCIDRDNTFYFIAGYTSGGAPYGLTWEEMGLEPWTFPDDELVSQNVHVDLFDEKPKRKKFKNHELVDGKLLQTNKKFSHLKQSQKSLITDWFRIEYSKYFDTHKKFPNTKSQKASIIDSVYERIEEREIWIPYGEITRYFYKIQTKMKNKISKKIAVSNDYKNQES